MNETPQKPKRIQPPLPPAPSAARRPLAPVPGDGAGGDASGGPREKKPADPTRYGDWEKNGRCIDF